MKKILSVVIAAIFAAGVFAQDNTPAMLKKKELFSKTELFDNSAIFSNAQANAELLKDYEENPSAYKANQLMPIATCYLAFGDIPKARAAVEAYLKDSPKNVRAIRMIGTICLLEKKTDEAIKYFKEAFDAGDERVVTFLASAYMLAQKNDEIAAYLPALKKLAKENLEALNIAVFYALRDPKNPDTNLKKELIENVDAKKAMQSATPESLNAVLRIYLSDRSAWTPQAVVLPARAAAFAEAWPIALEAYKKALAADPNNAIALRGMGLVSYRTGDVMGASKYIKKAYENGDKDAATDGMELFLLSNNIDIWNTFKPYIKDVSFTPQLRAGLVQYASRHSDASEIFFTAMSGDNTEPLYKDSAVLALIEECLKKYGSDSRAKGIAEKVAAEKAAK